MSLESFIASPRARHLLDAALAIWIACWIGLGAAIGVEVEDLSTLSQTVVREGHAVERISSTISRFGSLPFVGGSVKEGSKEVDAAGIAAVRGGQGSTATIHTLGILLAIAVSLLPSVAMLGLYLPLRAKLRERRAGQLASDAGGGGGGGGGGEGRKSGGEGRNSGSGERSGEDQGSDG